MEGNYLTAGELALIEQRGGYRQPYGYDGYGCHDRKRASGAAITGVVLGGAALAAVFAGVWGMNQASKARSKGNEKAIDILAGQALQERQSREAWQNYHAPTTTQYVDVRTGAGAFSGAGANAVSQAEALALLYNNGFGNGRNGQTCPTPVALYQPAMPCRCNTRDD